MQGCSKKGLNELINKLDFFPIPSIGDFELIQMASDTNVDLESLIEMLEKHPVILLKIISIANSPIFRGKSVIVDVKQAIIRIGLNKVGGVIITLFLGCELPCRESALFNKRKHNMESILTAYIANELAQTKKLGSSRLLYTIGLLHNMGTLLLVNLFPDRMNDVLKTTQPVDFNYTEAIMLNFGFNQFQAFVWLLKKWKLPSWGSGDIPS